MKLKHTKLLLWSIFMLLIASAVILVTCGCQRYSSPDPSETSLEQVDSSSASTGSYSESTSANSNSKKEESFTLDQEYENAIAQCQSNIDIANINAAYAQRWRELGDDYYASLLRSEYCQEIQAEEYVKEIHGNLISYIEKRRELEKDVVYAVYGSGSTVGIALQKYEYQQQRMYALEMYRLCRMMHVQCQTP